MSTKEWEGKVMKITPFWYNNKRGSIEINERLLVKSLSQIGFASYYLTSNKTIEPQYIYKTGNIIEPYAPIWIHNKAIEVIESGIIDQKILPAEKIGAIVDKLLKTKSIVKKEVLALLPELDKPLISDTKNTAWFFYQNTAVKVTGIGIELLPLESFKYYIWKSQIIDRDFKLIDNEEVMENSEYCIFIRNITSVKSGEKWEFNKERFDNLITLQGYLLHNYKDRANPRAVILMDASDRGEPNGRTGKGLKVEGVGKIRKMIKEYGKSFQDDNRFKFSMVTLDTKILFIDDVKANFNFENFFSAISEGIMVEPKFVNKYFIPFEISPKIVISTNYTVIGHGASHEARRYEFSLSNFYNEKHTPIKDFGHLFFDEWDSYQWSLFDSLMMYSVEAYLAKSVTKSEDLTMKRKKLVVETSEQFVGWVTHYDLSPGIKYEKEILYNDYVRSCDNVLDCDQSAFTRYLKKWAEIHNLKFDEPHSGDKRYIKFMPG
jgi:hypothetical protein